MRVESDPKNECELRVSFSFKRSDLRLKHSLIGVVVHLADVPTAGEPGSPALPNCVVRVALPPQSRLLEVKAETREAARVGDEVLPIAPLQPSRPGQRPDPQEPSVEKLPTPAFVPADPDLYAEATRRPAARLLATTSEGLNPVATIHLNPVRLTADGFLELASRIDLTLRYGPAEDDGQRQPASILRVASRAQAMRQVALTRRTVVNPAQVLDFSDLYPILHLGTDYLIITDNQRWNAQTMAPEGAAGGDLAASFGRLAAWKRQRGLRARLVTLGDIVSGTYGDFRTGSRDLQEVIRRFLKMAYADWGVAWVLLGGDTGIVPVRRVAGGREGNVNRQTVDPPPANTSFWTGTHLRMHVVSPGIWWGPATTNQLVRPDTGLLIPYDAAGTSDSATRGWYFTTDDSYGTLSATPTQFVRVNGPAAEVDANLQFLYEWNTIPTDLYYSSLAGPGYNQPGRHDWDLLDNGVYGQHYGANELDGINYTPTLSVGRAPVNSAAQADAFVDKVIAYEKLEQPGGAGLDEHWPNRVVLVSENWGGRLWIGASGSNPPGDNGFHHPAGQSHSLIKLAAAPDWNWSLLAYLGESDVRLLPYRMDAATAGRGWHFAKSATDLSPNSFQFAMPGGAVLELPFPSSWIAVYGTADELAPVGYIFNQTELDGSLADQEHLRTQMQSEMSGFRDVKRLYEDIQDMTPEQLADGPVELITSDGLRDALDAGPHIVSLSGHGSGDGCCKLSRSLADGLTNGYHTFLAYADSCLTNQFDGDSMSERLLNNANGGAVAYVGNTRFSWISVGDDIQRRFFREWATLGGDAHLGLLCDTRAALVNSFYWADGRWAVLSLNLLGDPEMPLWWSRPLKIRIPEVILLDELRIRVDPNPPDPPFRIDAPYDKVWGLARAHLRQGGREQLGLADPEGRIDLPLTGFQAGPATLTVTRPGHQPFVQQVEIRGAAGRPGCGPLAWVLRRKVQPG